MPAPSALSGPASLPASPFAGEAVRLPHIDPRRCTGCGRCVAVCGPCLLSLEVEHWVKAAVLHGAARCTGCSACAVACPFHAIAMRRPAAAR